MLFTALVQSLGLDPLTYTHRLHPLPFRVRCLPFGTASDDDRVSSLALIASTRREASGSFFVVRQF